MTHHTPRARLADVESRGEAALLSRDPERIAEWHRQVEQAQREVYAAEHAPSWESLLADPTSQPAGATEVAASIRAYEDATLASACACGGSIHSGCRR